MIKKENKSIMITLDPEHLELLNSLASRFHCSKTDIVKQALKVFAGSKNHVVRTSYKTYNDKVNIEEWNQILSNINSKENKQQDDDELPF